MRFANRAGRAFVMKGEDSGWDLEKESSGRFSSEPMQMWARHAEIREWLEGVDGTTAEAVRAEGLDAPVPVPPAIIAIGLNYAEHARETGFEPPTELPPIFAKFPSSITGAYGEVELPDGNVDWEVEVVAVVGSQMHHVAEEDVFDHLAGLTIGQDLSERVRQFSGPAPQFGLAKSFPGFAPIGPWVVSLDEFDDPNDIGLGCSIDGEVVQSGTTAGLIFSISRSIAELSKVLVLRPGDLVFTGTPDGVGIGLQPPRFLQRGEVLETWVEGIGRMSQRMV
ncbi:fumarylacetoacetate hydrolase family protein [Intrasporangium calvum]|uniref:Fumarylacetoacetate hydrolase family protein n=1 Tax=Intrasporangium calvum TaxID=53358 RepID=A0ABT5GFA2_9MICO|nr:fumarylacetoacetate hydrolase family protein [Intrasporangium calvum]MDC5696505.1 fumarylacetoacetate hydrolase family protein [Intrasporangium calvum]